MQNNDDWFQFGFHHIENHFFNYDQVFIVIAFNTET